MFCLGHVLRADKNQRLRLIIKGKIRESCAVRRKQMSWLKNIRQWAGNKNEEELFRLEEDKEVFATVVANVREMRNIH